jgi:hypothetical protein
MQGYRFGKAVTAAEITARLQSPDAFRPIDVPAVPLSAKVCSGTRP